MRYALRAGHSVTVADPDELADARRGRAEAEVVGSAWQPAEHALTDDVRSAAATAALSRPTVVWRGTQDPQAPLVVLLHDRRSDEAVTVGLADFLPADATYAIVRTPLDQGGRFADGDTGRPMSATEVTWFRRWIDEVAPTPRPVVLVGFSGGATFAGGLLLDDPTRYTGAAILHGTLPLDAGLPTGDGRLAGIPVLVARAEDDHVIPRELLERSWDYLHGESRASVTGLLEPGRHEFTFSSLAELQIWLAQLLDTRGRPA